MIKTKIELPDYIKREFKLMDVPEANNICDSCEDDSEISTEQRQKLHEEYERDKDDLLDDINCLLRLMKDKIQDGRLEDGEPFCYLSAVNMKARILGFFFEGDD